MDNTSDPLRPDQKLLEDLKGYPEKVKQKIREDLKLFTWGFLIVLLILVTLILGNFIISIENLIPELSRAGKLTVLFAGVVIFVGVIYAIFWKLRLHFGLTRETEFIELASRLLSESARGQVALLEKISEYNASLQLASEIITARVEREQLYKMKLVTDYTKTKVLEEVVGNVDFMHLNEPFCLKMVTSTRGLQGDQGFNIIKLIQERYTRNNYDLLRTKEAFHFSSLSLVVPQGQGTNEEYNEPDYLFSARLFCLKFLRSVYSMKLTEEDDNYLGFGFYNASQHFKKSGQLECKIRRKGNDIFPAFHLWGAHQLAIFPSISYESQKIDKGLLKACLIIDPTLQLSKEAHSDHVEHAKNTIQRAEAYFDEVLFNSSQPGDVESWVLTDRGEISCLHYHKQVNSKVVESYLASNASSVEEYRRKHLKADMHEALTESNCYSVLKQINMLKHFSDNKISLKHLKNYCEVSESILTTELGERVYCTIQDVENLINCLGQIAEIKE